MKLLPYSYKPNLLNNTFYKNVLFFSPFVKFFITEESMMPLLNPGSMILIFRWGEIKKKDIIVFQNPQEKKVKHFLIKQVMQIEKDSYYVVGINKEKSIDSRSFGWIKKESVVGKMILKLN